MSSIRQIETRKERRARERREKKKERKHIETQPFIDNGSSRPLLPFLIVAFCLGVGATVVFLNIKKGKEKESLIKSSKVTLEKQSLKGKSFSHVLDLTPEEVASYDMVELNLLCGSGLNGNEKDDLDQSLKTFDSLVEMVRQETKRNWRRWEQNPAEYENSEVYYRMGMLITVVRQDFKAKYNPKLITDPSKRIGNDIFYKDASNVFLQGLLTGKKMGTCASMPVLYVAIARRLGYPVYLVSTKGHLFCRWEDDKERMNFEGTGEGVRNDPDEAYHKFPYPLSKREIENSTYLKNLTPEQELAIFLDTRATCLVASGRNAEALIAQAQAIRLTQKDGLTGLMESVAFGKMIPNQVFTLLGQRNTQKKKKRFL